MHFLNCALRGFLSSDFYPPKQRFFCLCLFSRFVWKIYCPKKRKPAEKAGASKLTTTQVLQALASATARARGIFQQKNIRGLPKSVAGATGFLLAVLSLPNTL